MQSETSETRLASEHGGKLALFPGNEGQKKTVIDVPERSVSPVFLDQLDLNHVTLVATISPALQRLKPIFLTTSDVHLRDPDL
jgi:hypothetical protein